MSAREELFRGLIEHACCFDDDEANKLLDAFAHELAEQQRAWTREPLTDAGAEEYGSVDNILRGADRIDPQVSTP